ncbi:hypothetical protein P4T48_10080 [Bacillus paramycoides]|uniref:hypothetical protein n=1 Tax=Bacillus paramycoides TaxID=2026194 RepID=UPI002E2235A0|nr:hypothetical protein [Bacillus paramycoides]
MNKNLKFTQMMIGISSMALSFGSVKPIDTPFKENAFIRLYVRHKDHSNVEINHKEVTSYEGVQKDDLPYKSKRKITY